MKVRQVRDYVRRAIGWSLARLRALRADTVGAVAIIVGLMAPVLIGAMGLGSEAGYWYLTQRQLQNAADTGAHAAGVRLATGGDMAALQATSEYVAYKGEIDTGAVVTVNHPPTSGAFAGNGSAVEVIVTETLPRLLSAIFDTTPVAISGRAVAVGDGGASGCVVALSSTVQNALTVSGSVNINLQGCDMVSNAVGQSFYMEGTSSLVSTRCVQTVGTAFVRPSLSTDCAYLRQNAPPLADPYASVPEPAMPWPACSSGTVGQNNTTTAVTADNPHSSGMLSKRFCNGLTLSGTVNFGPGLYIIQGGPFRIAANARITGNEVIFFLADGVAIDFAGSARINISAPTTGTYAGILIFGSRDATAVTHILSGDSQTSFNGAIYTPSSRLEYAGSSSATTNGCTQLIGDTVQIRGSGSVAINCANTAGNPANTGLYVRLIE